VEDGVTGAVVSLWAWPAGAEAPALPVHPSAVRVRRLFQEGVQRYLVTEALNGLALDQRSRPGPLSLRQAVAWLGELGGVLDLAHRLGMLHGRLEEKWVWTTTAGRLKLMWPAGPVTAETEDDRRDFAALAARMLAPFPVADAARAVCDRGTAGRFATCREFLAALDGALWIGTARPPELPVLRHPRRIHGPQVVAYLLAGGGGLAALTGAAVWLLAGR
jgi:hypothetical protein